MGAYGSWVAPRLIRWMVKSISSRTLARGTGRIYPRRPTSGVPYARYGAGYNA
jgi:hypothetical protein